MAKQRTAEEQAKLNGQLFAAAIAGDVEAVKKHLREGAEINALGHNHRYTSLHFAAWKGHTETVRALLEAGAEVDAKNEYQGVPLHIAAIGGNTDAIKALLAAGADPTLKNSAGNTPSDNARRPHPDLADYMQSIADGKTKRPTPKEVGLDMKKRNVALKSAKPVIGEHTAKVLTGMEAQRQAAINDPSEGI